MPCEFKREEHSKGLALIRKGEVRRRPITELEETMETMQRLISEIAVMSEITVNCNLSQDKMCTPAGANLEL